MLNTWPSMRTLKILFPVTLILNFLLITSLWDYLFLEVKGPAIVPEKNEYPVLLLQKKNDSVFALNLTKFPIELEGISVPPAVSINERVESTRLPTLVSKGKLLWQNKAYDFPSDYAKIAPEITDIQEIPFCPVCRKTDKTWTIPTGSYKISEMIIIPAGITFVIEPGSVLNFSKGSGIFSRSPLTANGLVTKPILLDGADWNGVTILNQSPLASSLSYFNLKGAGGFDIFGMRYSASLNFIMGTINLNNVFISNSLAEDALNIKWASGTINDLKVDNSFSDAVDIDWSEVKLKHINISRAKNDCLDFSGGMIEAHHLQLSACHDKAISNGEGNNLKVKNVAISESQTGVANKDGAVIDIEKVSFTKTVKPFNQYHQKRFYPEPEFNLIDTPIMGSDVGPSTFQAGKKSGHSTL